VKASKGDLNLGGQEFDNRIAEGLIKQFQEESKMDLMTDLPAIQRARVNF
jgi:molecular chaperone DnaK (HSP70)